MSLIETPASHRAKAVMREKVTRQELLGTFVPFTQQLDFLNKQIEQLQKIVTFHDNLIATR